MSRRVELKVPAQVEVAEQAIELARVWAADGRQHVALATGLWRDPAAWGLALTDLARHIASAYEQAEGIPYAEALARIRTALDAEWEAPSDTPKGGLVS